MATPPPLPRRTLSGLPPPNLAPLSLPPPLARHQPWAPQSAMPPPLPPKGQPTLVFATIKEASEAATEALRAKLASRLLNEEELDRFKNLIVFAKTAVDSLFQGRHKSPDHGSGGEFSEFQPYEAGLPVGALDWQVYARSKKLVVRRFLQETDMAVHLVVDASRSMAYRGGKRDHKGLRAARVAAALAFLMMRQGDKVSLTLVGDKVLEHLPVGGTRRHLQAILRALVKPAHETEGRTNLPAAIAECQRLLKRRGRIVMLSDFLGHPPGEVLDALAPFRHRRFEILLMQVTDPDEMSLPDAPLARFVDLETNESVEVEPAEIRADFEARMKRRAEEFASGGLRQRIDFAVVDNAAPYRDAIETYLGFRHSRI